jgi:type I restriction enzyme, R subunit
MSETPKLTQQQLEAHLWKAADILRGKIDSSDYKDEIELAAARKAAELKAELTDAAADNPLRFGPFSDRVREIIRMLDEAHLNAREALAELEKLASDYLDEKSRFAGSGLGERAYGVYTILRAFRPETAAGVGEGGLGTEAPAGGGGSGSARDGDGGLSGLRATAQRIHELYATDATAPPGWHLKEQLKKELRQQVRRLAHAAGLTDLQAVPARVQDYALRHYVKLVG